METIKIHKAMGFDKPEIEGIRIEIDILLDDIIPTDQSVIEKEMETYKADAALLFRALTESLPSGTVDQLLVLFLNKSE